MSARGNQPLVQTSKTGTTLVSLRTRKGEGGGLELTRAKRECNEMGTEKQAGEVQICKDCRPWEGIWILF